MQRPRFDDEFRDLASLAYRVAYESSAIVRLRKTSPRSHWLGRTNAGSGSATITRRGLLVSLGTWRSMKFVVADRRQLMLDVSTPRC
jgi:hypothetical protein